MSALHGRKIIVTGAAGALGQALLSAARAGGAIVTGLTRADADLSDPAATEAAFRRAAENLGGLDGLVNAAGGFAYSSVADAAPEMWRDMFERNLMSAAHACRAALPLMGRGAAIVNVTSASALAAGPGMAPYAASKAGLLSLTQGLAAEQREAGIRVNAVAVTIMDTPQNRGDMPDADRSRWVSTEAVAAIACFLLSDEARAVNGAAVPAGS